MIETTVVIPAGRSFPERRSDRDVPLLPAPGRAPLRHAGRAPKALDAFSRVPAPREIRPARGCLPAHGYRYAAPQRAAGANADDMTRQLLPALDGMLQLARLLAENDGERLSPRQVDYAQTLYSTAAELRLALARMLARAGPERDMPAMGGKEMNATSAMETMSATPFPAGRLAGRKLLLAASDMRIIYPLIGALEAQGMRVVLALDENELGAVLVREADLDVVLFDGADGRFSAERIMWRLLAIGQARPLIELVELMESGGAPDDSNDKCAPVLNVERLLELLRAHLPDPGRA